MQAKQNGATNCVFERDSNSASSFAAALQSPASPSAICQVRRHDARPVNTDSCLKRFDCLSKALLGGLHQAHDCAINKRRPAFHWPEETRKQPAPRRKSS